MNDRVKLKWHRGYRVVDGEVVEVREATITAAQFEELTGTKLPPEPEPAYVAWPVAPEDAPVSN